MSARVEHRGRGLSGPLSRLLRPPLRRRRPILLALVYGVFLVLVGLTASAHAVLVAAHFSTMSLNTIVGHDRDLVRLFADGNLTPDDLTPGGVAPDRIEYLQAQLRSVVARNEILRIEVRNPAGIILFSDQPGLIGWPAPITPAFSDAAGGRASAAVVEATAGHEATGVPLTASSVIRAYLPIVGRDGKTLAIVGVWRDATGVLRAIETTRGDILLVTLLAAGILAVLLFLIFRSAQARIARQTDELLESMRRDALTGMLNHGALVSGLTDAIEVERRMGGQISVAHVDIDNFRLLNDTHGHSAGDKVLLDVAWLLESAISEAGVAMLVGRYGPDEFLLVGSGVAAGRVEPAIERLRRGLVDLAPQFGGSERLPVTVSVGISTFPSDAGGVTGLLSAAAVALSEAKAGGGDAVRTAGSVGQDRPMAGGFDVLQGLVFAIDTKDRYTKRHSEDVARYTVFLAERLDLSEEMRESIRVAGLLHDVGKIGIPDAILRKPARLTADEYDVVKQHVALGDLIVRDLPGVELIREGIRHHHERWDGTGYLTGLRGTEIPLIARMMAVADAFSAMTSSRPYRKALSVTEALRRLGDAAGSQLDEDLVKAFILGIETAPNPPLPDAGPIAGLWVPIRRAA